MSIGRVKVLHLICGVLMSVMLMALTILPVFSQQNREVQANPLPSFDSPWFSKVRLKTDSLLFTTDRNWVVYQGDEYLPFFYDQSSPTVVVDIYPSEQFKSGYLELGRSQDYEVVDSAAFLEGAYFRFKMQFRNLYQSGPINLVLGFDTPDGKVLRTSVKLLPYTRTVARLLPKDEDLFIGEPKVFELDCNNPQLIKAENLWQSTKDYDYKLNYEDRVLKLYLIPKESGKIDIRIPLQSRQPNVYGNRVMLDLPILRGSFNVKAGRLAFLNLDKTDITLEQDFGRGIEVQIENNRALQLKKTYRIEAQLEPGSQFIGELYTRSVLNNDKVLCYFRPFALHSRSEGYLYIKDCDEVKFITNFTISERTQIRAVSVLREGGEWSNNLSVLPGSNVELRIEGTGLSKATFTIEDVDKVVRDSIRNNENLVVLKFKVPSNIAKRSLTIFAGTKSAGYQLNVREFQEPRQFDFVNLSFGDYKQPFSAIDQPILYDKPISDMVIKFNPNLIDDAKKLYGKQYLEVTVTYYNNRGEFIESKVLNNIVICPGESSPRAQYYDQKDCNKNEINLNYWMTRKPIDLNDWSKIEITINHRASAYSTTGFSKKAMVILQRHYTFDVDVSIPGGLLVRKLNEPGFGGFSGISLAILPQFSFYKPDKIEKLRPYKIGAGILALNAFNFSDNNVNRDVGLVVLGSVFPTKTGAKFSFPLYAGFGYFLREASFFWVLGPGIQLRL